MARLYSNENLAIDLVEALRKFNHDILSSYDAGQANQGIPDDEVLKYATLNDRCVITFNRDDFVALHRNGVSQTCALPISSDSSGATPQPLNSSSTTKSTEVESKAIRNSRVFEINEKDRSAHYPRW